MTKEHEVPEISEDELHAYVDGEIAAERRAAVETWLGRNPDRAREIDTWRGQNEAIRALFPPAPEEPGDRTILRLRRAPRTRVSVAAMAATFLATFALGAGAGLGVDRLLRDGETETLAAATIAEASRVNYLVYSSEVRHPVEVRSDEKDHLVAWLGKRIGGQLRAPDLSPQGFHLVGGRLVTYGNGPGALLMYEDEGGARLTMLAARNGRNAETGFRFDREGEVNTFYWIDGPFGFALSGTVQRDRLQGIAEAVYHQIST